MQLNYTFSIKLSELTQGHNLTGEQILGDLIINLTQIDSLDCKLHPRISMRPSQIYITSRAFSQELSLIDIYVLVDLKQIGHYVCQFVPLEFLYYQLGLSYRLA